MKVRKPTEIHACTDSVRARRAWGILVPKTATPAPNSARISVQSSSEPSWLPQVAATLNNMGFSELEFSTTLRTVKSLTTKAHISAPKARARNTSCPSAVDCAERIHTRLPRAAPAIGTTDCTTASASARARPNCPSSGIMAPLPMGCQIIATVLAAER